MTQIYRDLTDTDALNLTFSTPVQHEDRRHSEKFLDWMAKHRRLLYASVEKLRKCEEYIVCAQRCRDAHGSIKGERNREQNGKSIRTYEEQAWQLYKEAVKGIHQSKVSVEVGCAELFTDEALALAKKKPAVL